MTELVGVLEDSALALEDVALGPGGTYAVSDAARDTLLFAHDGAGIIALAEGMHPLSSRAAALVLAGEEATISAGESGLACLHATVGPEADRHAPLGERKVVVPLDTAATDRATGARAFQILIGPHNGSTRATLFMGFVPPGKAPWHYHLYDEIVWIAEGVGRLHRGSRVEDLGPGSSFRLRPREVHIVENASPDRALGLIGVFTPAGSPSAAYLTPEVAAEYGVVG